MKRAIRTCSIATFSTLSLLLAVAVVAPAAGASARVIPQDMVRTTTAAAGAAAAAAAAVAGAACRNAIGCGSCRRLQLYAAAAVMMRWQHRSLHWPPNIGINGKGNGSGTQQLPTHGLVMVVMVIVLLLQWPSLATSLMMMMMMMMMMRAGL